MIAAPAPDWSPASWQDKEVLQQPDYPDPDALAAVLTQLAASPPLVTSWEVETLRTQLAEASYGLPRGDEWRALRRRYGRTNFQK